MYLKILQDLLKIMKDDSSRNIGRDLSRSAFVARVNNPNLPFWLSFPRLPARPASGRLGVRLRPRTAHRRPIEGSGIDHVEILTFTLRGRHNRPRRGGRARARVRSISLPLDR